MGKGPLSGLFGLGRREPLLRLDAFRERVIDKISERFPEARIERFEDDGVKVEPRPGEGASTHRLSRAYSIYLQDRQSLGSLIDHFVSWVDREPDAATPEAVRMLARPSALLEHMRPGDPPLHKHMAGGLIAIVALDAADSISFPPASDLRTQLRMDDEAIWSRALANTRLQFPKMAVPKRNSLLPIISQDGSAPGLLADDALWADLDGKARGGLLAAPVERNVLLLASPASAEGVSALRQLIVEAAEQPDFLSAAVLVRQDGRWAEVEEEDSAFAAGPVKH